MTMLRVEPQTTPLRGTVTVPGDKSISHRAVMLASLTSGTSHIRRWLPAGDTLATLAAMQALGVAIAIRQPDPHAWDLTITGRGLDGLQVPAGVLDCRNAGTCMRLLAGILAGQSFPSTLDGSEQLRRRPMRRIVAPLRQMGANIEAADDKAPLHIRPGRLHGFRYEMPVASAQVKSALLLAGLYAAGPTHVYQPGPARDHTERLLAALGVELHVDGGWITLTPPATRSLTPVQLTVPADPSSAAFLQVAATIVPHSQVTITNVGLNETRTGLLDLLAAMGADLAVSGRRETGGEPAGDLTCRFAELHATDAAGEVVVRAIDEFPVWAVAASQAAGSSTLRDAAELRVKEVDRISVLAGELRRLGVVLAEQADGFTVVGPGRVQGGQVDSHGDHRLGMALAVAGLVAASPVYIQHADCIADSFPGFVSTMQALGAQMAWIA